MASLYFHIPFCHHKCIYCDFYSIARKFDLSKYTEALIKELLHRRFFFENKVALRSIYFGGGTPSLLSIKDLNKIFQTIYRLFPIDKDCEITLEANPENITKDYIYELEQLGVNRISLGVQSFEDGDLKLLNRSHNSLLAKQVIEILKNSNIKNISIDLISNLPYMDLQRWKSNLDTFLSFNLPHISCYTLMREENTMLDKLLKKNKLSLLSEIEQVKQMEETMRILEEKKFIHYETSSFALEGFYSRHNMAYWTFEKYLGIGSAAHSYNGKERFWNVADVFQYTQSVLNDDFSSIVEKEELTKQNKYNEYVMLSSRMHKGLSLDYVKDNFLEYYSYFSIQIEKLIKDGFLTKELSLTNKGWLLQDEMILRLAYS